MKDDRTALLYEAPPRIDRWFRWVVGGLLLGLLIFGIILLAIEIIGAYIMFGATILIGLLFWAVIPRSFSIYQDRLVIRLGGPFASRTMLQHIMSVNRGKPHDAIASSGIRFATSTSGVLEIVRTHGLDLIITPIESEVFMEQLEQARRALAEKTAQ